MKVPVEGLQQKVPVEGEVINRWVPVEVEGSSEEFQQKLKLPAKSFEMKAEGSS